MYWEGQAAQRLQANLDRNSQETVSKTQTLERKMKKHKIKYQKDSSKGLLQPRIFKLLEMDLHPQLARH